MTVPEATAGSRARANAWRVAGLLAGLALALVAVLAARGRGVESRALDNILAGAGLERRQPAVAGAARIDPDPVRGRLRVARALLAEAYDGSSFAGLPIRELVDEASRIPERLELARGLAAAALADRPASWQAAMIGGAASYRLWAMRGDPRVFDSRAEWEGLLAAAAALAPGEDEPPRLLAWARLELWPVLDEGERRETRELLRRAFADAQTFGRLAEAWLDAAGSRAEAFALVPRSPAAWDLVVGTYAARSDWDAYLAARERRERVLQADLAARLDELARRRRGGDEAGARAEALAIVAMAPVEGRYTHTVEQALALCPPVPAGQDHAGAFLGWLRWHADLYLRGRPGLSNEAAQRLLSGVAEPRPAEAALFALSAGDIDRAEVFERRSELLHAEEWGPYCLAKARALARRREAEAARGILATVHRSLRGSPSELDVRLEVARAGGDSATEADARNQLALVAAAAWPATEWRWRSGQARLDLAAVESAGGLEVAFDEVPPAGGIVRILVDGDVAAVAAVEPGRSLRVLHRLDAGPHLVQLDTVAGGRAVPGPVALLPP